MRERAASLDIRVRQTGALVAEHQRDIAVAHEFVRALGQCARRGICSGPYSRMRAVSATDQRTPTSASASVSTTCADANTSSTPLAMAMASGFCWTSATRGATSTRRAKPIVLSARAVAPMLPG